MAQRYEFRKGADVFGSDGQKIGDVKDVGTNFLDVSTGFLGFGGELYIPFDAVNRVEDDRIYLNVPSDRVSSMGWNQKPAEVAGAGRPETYAGTMPAAAERRPAQTALPENVTGYSLYSSDDKDIGKIYDQGPNYVHVKTGLFGLGGDLYVPVSAIDHCSNDRCYLNIPADRIHTMGWNRMPSEQAAPAREQMVTREAAPPTPVQREAPEAPREYRGTEEEARRIPLRDEELEVHKHREKVGEVVISKDVVEEQRTINVPVSREEITIERRIVDRPSEGEIPSAGKEEQVVRIPVYEDVVDVEKHPHIHEELVVEPEDVTTQERVTRTVRREVPEVKMTGEAEKFVKEEGKVEETPPEERKEQRRQGR